MLPTIATLQEHLFKMELTLTHPIVHDEDPESEGYQASILDPRFKDLEFASENFEAAKQFLK
ncbi:3973_t:CDS:2 [Gigaspora rosea]|nr:3973_t:CDS:2 [Gigaspora rosea]